MRDARPLSISVHSRAIFAQFEIALSPAVLPRHLLNFSPHSLMMQSLYRLPHSIIELYEDILAFRSRSALISVENNRYSSPVQGRSRRHVSILVPHSVSVSPAHFEKSLPHFSIMQARRLLSHMFAPPCVFNFVVFVASAASSAARWARICAAKESAPAFASVPVLFTISSNWDDLSSI